MPESVCHDPGFRPPTRDRIRIVCLVPECDEERDAELWWQRVGGLLYGPDELGDCDTDAPLDRTALVALLAGPIGGYCPGAVSRRDRWRWVCDPA